MVDCGDRVMYFSVHGYQHGAFWPHLRQSDYHHIGRGAGLGYNVNVPLNHVGMGDKDYMAIFHQLLLPLAYEVRFSFTAFSWPGLYLRNLFLG